MQQEIEKFEFFARLLENPSVDYDTDFVVLTILASARRIQNNLINHLTPFNFSRLKDRIEKVLLLIEEVVTLNKITDVEDDEIFDKAQDCFIEFRELFLANETLKSLGINTIDNEIQKMDQTLRECWSSFRCLSKIYTNIQRNEFFPSYWWGKTSPSFDVDKCSETDKCFYYTIDTNLSVSQTEQFEKHLKTCPVCSKLHVDLLAC